MSHATDHVGSMAELRQRARAAAERVNAEHRGKLSIREARCIDALLARQPGKALAIECEAVLHLANRVGATEEHH